MFEAVYDLHETNFVHQDLKPDNFRVTSDGFVKLIDFGISKKYLDDNGKHKQIGKFGFEGTPSFASTNAM